MWLWRQAGQARAPAPTDQGPDKRVGGSAGWGLGGVEGTSCKDWVKLQKEEAQVGGWEGAAELRDPHSA